MTSKNRIEWLEILLGELVDEERDIMAEALGGALEGLRKQSPDKPDTVEAAENLAESKADALRVRDAQLDECREAGRKSRARVAMLEGVLLEAKEFVDMIDDAEMWGRIDGVLKHGR